MGADVGGGDRGVAQPPDLRRDALRRGKREVEKGSGANKELARDLASFGLDSGGLLIGVEEEKVNRTWRLHPVALGGLPERVEQIAQQGVDPPLFVIPHVILSSTDPTNGYVFVEVPASAVAPHMVDGIYYGRGDKIRTRLSDAEVIRYHSRRASLEEVPERLLEEEGSPGTHARRRAPERAHVSGRSAHYRVTLHWRGTSHVRRTRNSSR